ncbi:MAG: nucleoside-diphosphate kinase [Muribaculaceae bacterium]|nr:nucleoside-diphosphate kinase [Muribaculaceae bacterium]
MERTLILLKPSCVGRGLIGEVTSRLEKKGLVICGMKMIQLDEKILREHYSHLVEKPFFPVLVKGMMATPVIAMCLKGVDAVEVVRLMCGVTNGRKAAPGTIRGDFSMSGSQNIIHASDSPENAEIEIARFFKPEELFDYSPLEIGYIYSPDEV